MRSLAKQFTQSVACYLVLLLAVPYAEAATPDLPSAPQPSGSVKTVSIEPVPLARRLPSANLTIAKNVPPSIAPSESGTSQPSEVEQNTQSPAQQKTPQSKGPGSPHPVGTAAAPYVNTNGIAASRPAGAAIAPAKQRRVRILAVRIGLLVGAAIAIGTVTALSLGSQSRP